jgi:hypothetical protein
VGVWSISFGLNLKTKNPGMKAGARDASPPVHMIKLTQEREIAPYT